MSRQCGRLCCVAVVSMLLLPWLTPAHAAVQYPCLDATIIKTAADLQNVNNDLAGKYCLGNDLDLKGIANFTPIGSFSGQFNGQGHVIRNLTITSSIVNDGVGLFRSIAGSVRNLGIVNAKVTWTGTSVSCSGCVDEIDVGILAGVVGSGSSVSTSYSTGSVTATGHSDDDGGGVRMWVGGLIGEVSSFVPTPGTVTNSWSSAAVTAVDDYQQAAVGGLAGANTGGHISRSFATGAVSCDVNCVAGGLVGDNFLSVVKQSFASGPVTVVVGANSVAGGLAGSNVNVTIEQSYASGPVAGGNGSVLGGLVGSLWRFAQNDPGSISQSYAVGAIRGACSLCGGLVAAQENVPTPVTQSYWDTNTTGKAASAGGTGETTMQLQAALPAGFSTSLWAITAGVSLPYFGAGSPAFASALATTVAANKVFTFLPAVQHEPSEYIKPDKYDLTSDLTSLATVYTMIARAIGVTDNVAALKGVKIDKYFWDEKTQTTSWTGPVTQHATLGTLAPIGSAAALDNSNVIGALNQRKVVILRGSYTGAAKGVFHYMLATLYTKDSNNTVTDVIANDPWTGQQVTINPTTKKVVSPANFPLPNFTVDGYQPVTLASFLKISPIY